MAVVIVVAVFVRAVIVGVLMRSIAPRVSVPHRRRHRRHDRQTGGQCGAKQAGRACGRHGAHTGKTEIYSKDRQISRPGQAGSPGFREISKSLYLLVSLADWSNSALIVRQESRWQGESAFQTSATSH